MLLQSLVKAKVLSLPIILMNNASDKLYVLIYIVINCMTTHGYIPDKFIENLLISIIEDKKGQVTDGENYRHIAITCVASKKCWKLC